MALPPKLEQAAINFKLNAINGCQLTETLALAKTLSERLYRELLTLIED